ncbi:Uncharacterised protein [Citrobacter werkmanii]|uniref:Uncharacterized protein n=1 Tax=Citrobacter werkmanii TaxID=67827 RepID=A0ABN7H249_9ENTR|nr:Uncharacterised protein [Citrobacter werkmanii]CAC9155753.1 Uncharacterised protein [Citrobacter werkmanii]CAC9172378.1 Uncharacterised protein [Citrobacter werkmanii]CAC9200475.1 Uncharacterised protein [Citrobacter werkmanii]CAC9206366.1 Uncharacterised protein [Citrobacter werkmanii]
MPFCQAPPTAGRRRVLRDEYRVTTHWRLLPIISGKSGSQPFGNKIGCMLFNNRRAFIQTILPFFLAEAKPRAKRRFRQPGKKRIERIHQ